MILHYIKEYKFKKMYMNLLKNHNKRKRQTNRKNITDPITTSKQKMRETGRFD